MDLYCLGFGVDCQSALCGIIGNQSQPQCCHGPSFGAALVEDKYCSSSVDEPCLVPEQCGAVLCTGRLGEVGKCVLLPDGAPCEASWDCADYAECGIVGSEEGPRVCCGKGFTYGHTLAGVLLDSEIYCVNLGLASPCLHSGQCASGLLCSGGQCSPQL